MESPLTMEKLTMLLVLADPEDSDQYPFWICEVDKVGVDANSPRFNQLQVFLYEIKRTRGENLLQS